MSRTSHLSSLPTGGSSDQHQKFSKIAVKAADLSLTKSKVIKKGYNWIDYLKWLKKELPDNFSELFNSSLESKDEAQSFLNVLNMKELQKQCKKLDKITITSPDGELTLSKRLLALFIPIYKTAFSGKFNDAGQSEITLPPDEDFEIYQDALEFLFFNKNIKFEGENIDEFLTLANFLDIASLKDHCEDWLIDNFNDIDTLDLIQLDIQHQLSDNFKEHLQKRANEEAETIIRDNPLFWKKIPAELEKIAPYVTELNFSKSFTVYFEHVAAFANKHLAVFANLKSLSLPSYIGDKEFATLPKLDFLENINLGKTRITDVSLRYLARFPSLLALNLTHTRITNAGLAKISNLTNLQSLNLHNCKGITNGSLVHIANLTNLQSLDLSNTEIPDADLAYIANLTNLQSLNLHNCKGITNGGLAHIANKTNLQSLNLSNTGTTDAGLAYIANLTNLQSLDLSNTEITDAGLAHIANLTNLQSLNLCYTGITDAGLVHIANKTDLQSLDLSCTGIRDGGIAHILNCTNLESLDLSYCKNIKDSGFAHIADLKNLRALGLKKTRITNTGLAKIANLTKLEFLNLRECESITDEGFTYISNLKRLQYLNLSETFITGKGFAHVVKLKKLRYLNLYLTKINNTDLIQIANLKNLIALDLMFSRVTKKGLIHIEKLEKLQYLRILSNMVKLNKKKYYQLIKLNNHQIFSIDDYESYRSAFC